MKTKEDARKLMEEWVQSDSLRKHCLSVATAMEAYANYFITQGKFGDPKSDPPIQPSEEEARKIIDKWWICGLLHDFDWEKFPTLDEHPIKGCQELRKLEYPEEIIEAILGHNKATGIKRYSLMAKTLFAVDELSGLIIALARVRPGKFDGMNAKSVKKAMKKKDFAAAINRNDIIHGMDDLELKSDEDKNLHLELVVRALSRIQKELGI